MSVQKQNRSTNNLRTVFLGQSTIQLWTHMLHKLNSRHFTENHCFTKNCCEGQHIAGISNAAAVQNHVYFWQGVVLLFARVFQMSNLPSEAAGLRLFCLFVFFFFFQPILCPKDERQHGKRRVLESKMKYWIQKVRQQKAMRVFLRLISQKLKAIKQVTYITRSNVDKSLINFLDI